MMRQFEDYFLESFDHATGWYPDNRYEGLNDTADRLMQFGLPKLMQFRLPTGLNLSFSSLATPNFATSYRLGAGGSFDGSISYLYSSVPLRAVHSNSKTIPLPALLRSYRPLQPLPPRAAAAAAAGETPAPAPAPAIPPERLTAQEVLQDFAKQPWLVFGRLFLPLSMLEAQVTKRITPTFRLQVKAVSQSDYPNGGNILGSLQFNKPHYGVESLVWTEGGLLVLRGLYNFGGDAAPVGSLAPTAAGSAVADHGSLPSGNGGNGGSGGNGSGNGHGNGHGNGNGNGNGHSNGGSGGTVSEERERIYGRFSAGGEIFYGVLNKTAGASVGGRFATLPAHRGTPLTATLTLAPLVGNIGATFAVMARDKCSLSTRFDFNVYSYESDWTVGMELWGTGRVAGLIDGTKTDEGPAAESAARKTEIEASPPRKKERSFQAKLEWRLDDDASGGGEAPSPAKSQPAASEKSDGKEKEPFSGVLKARMDQHCRVAMLWEGRLKSLIFSLGTIVSLSQPEQSFRSIGLEIQYSS
ncbi:mitochondrial distribution and morphology protein 10 [Gaeumannomyces tritici R3-111a-1]|uniref:Mitochondrial distribution and morphology protein 10 n=1 Tax=Gaeumannomyces tritici (strain R3-111a-1) TaxID=644352 RepID=J3NIQ7_GAET3|nr:mitochondrial distribution and morphology protein 10 [Gaeumannomyces tritici R3-111a-1]EJT81156.1 mitochondrial distribution and morphology protein 10 [Gaeumannomyces tritici R3-111a-1]